MGLVSKDIVFHSQVVNNINKVFKKVNNLYCRLL